VLLHAFVGNAERDRNRIGSVTYHDHGGAHLLYGKAFIERVSVILCKQVSVSLPFKRSSHDDHDIDT
jgi:hypothetical protein